MDGRERDMQRIFNAGLGINLPSISALKILAHQSTEQGDDRFKGMFSVLAYGHGFYDAAYRFEMRIAA